MQLKMQFKVYFRIQKVRLQNDTDESDYDHYQYVTREIPAEGESADYELSSGNYVVGEIREGPIQRY